MLVVENDGNGGVSHTYVASHTFVADSPYTAPIVYLKTFFSQKILPITPPNFWKRGRGTRDLSENIVIIAKNRRCRRHSSLKVIRVKKSMIFNIIFVVLRENIFLLFLHKFIQNKLNFKV